MLRRAVRAAQWPISLVLLAALGLAPLAVDGRSVQPVEEGIVHGRITTRGGTPIAGASVEARSLDQPRTRIPDVGNVSGADGRYTWVLPAGTYEISVSAEGYARVSKEVSVRAAQRDRLDFTLTRTRWSPRCAAVARREPAIRPWRPRSPWQAGPREHGAAQLLQLDDPPSVAGIRRVPHDGAG